MIADVTPTLVAAMNLSGAALAGLAVGVEREWSGQASGPTGRFAGVRTFLLLGILGGLAGWAIRGALVPIAVTLLAGGAAFTIAAYVSATRRPDVALDGTTEVAALVVLALGTVSGLGNVGLACAIAAVVVLALSEKTRIQRLLHRVSDHELRSALQFAVMSLVVLPVMPATPVAPGGVGLRTLWALVVLFSGINFAGYIARRMVGLERGDGVTGLLGGLVSSTAVTLQFSRASRHEPGAAASLALGVVGACTVLVGRIALASAVLNPRVSLALVPYLAPMAVVGLVIVAIGLARPSRLPTVQTSAAAGATESPLRFRSALLLAALFLAATTMTTLAHRYWGHGGVLTTAAFVGLTDLDALTVSMSRMGATPAAAALGARGIAVGVLANTAVKLGIVLAIGAPAFRRRTALGLLALGAAGLVGVWLGTAPVVRDTIGALIAAR